MTVTNKIEAMLQADFHQECVFHSDQKSKYFCWDCGARLALCETCKKSDHNGHNVQQIYKASRMNALRAVEAKTMFPISEIQPHSNNSWSVLYLYTRACPFALKKRPIRTTKEQSSCQQCGYDMTKDGYKFCSIQCQNVHEKLKEETEVSQKRKRRRKGIPVRSPLF